MKSSSRANTYSHKVTSALIVALGLCSLVLFSCGSPQEQMESLGEKQAWDRIASKTQNYLTRIEQGSNYENEEKIAAINTGVTLLFTNGRYEKLGFLTEYFNNPSMKNIVFDAMATGDNHLPPFTWFPFDDFFFKSSDDLDPLWARYFQSYSDTDWLEVFGLIDRMDGTNNAHSKLAADSAWTHSENLCNNMLAMGAAKAVVQEGYKTVNLELGKVRLASNLEEYEGQLRRAEFKLDKVQKTVMEYEDNTKMISGVIRYRDTDYDGVVYRCNAGYSGDFLLRMTEHEYEGPGRFSLLVKREGDARVSVPGGFTQTWPFYVEVSSWMKSQYEADKSEAKSLKSEVYTLSRKIKATERDIAKADVTLTQLPNWLR